MKSSSTAKKTTTEAVADQSEITMSNLRSLSTSEIRGKMIGGLKLHDDNLVEVARCVLVIEERGEEITEVDEITLHSLRMIGHGTLVPSLLVPLLSRPAVLEAVSKLPIKKQLEIARDHTVNVVRENGTGPKTQKVNVATLTGAEIVRVFYGNRMRNPREQAAMIVRSTDPTNTEDTRLIGFRLTVARAENLRRKSKELGVSVNSIILSCIETHGY